MPPAATDTKQYEPGCGEAQKMKQAMRQYENVPFDESVLRKPCECRDLETRRVQRKQEQDGKDRQKNQRESGSRSASSVGHNKIIEYGRPIESPQAKLTEDGSLACTCHQVGGDVVEMAAIPRSVYETPEALNPAGKVLTRTVRPLLPTA